MLSLESQIIYQSLLLYNSFIMPQFNYCSLIWMFCGKIDSNDVNRTHKRALHILFNDFTSSFEELLLEANQSTIHRKNLQKLVVEVYSSLTQQNTSFLGDMFQEKHIDYCRILSSFGLYIINLKTDNVEIKLRNFSNIIKP